MADRYMTYLWQEVRGDKWWRIQSNDPSVKRKLQRRKNTSLCIKCYNDPMKVFRTQYYKPEKARKSLERITGQKPEKDAVNDLFFVETAPILTSKSRCQGS